MSAERGSPVASHLPEHRPLGLVGLEVDVSTGEPPVDDALASRRRLARLAAIVEEMPAKMRQAFRLHKLDGLSQGETAREMNISVSAVEKHISAALKTLLKKMEDLTFL